MVRKVADCRDFPSDTPCTLTISGEEPEVLKAAADHAVSVHGHKRTPELEDEIRKMLKPEVSPVQPGAQSAQRTQQRQ